MSELEINTDCLKRWSKMTEAQKKKFTDLNAQDKLRHEKQLTDLKKNGFFVLADGSKSTDEKNVPKTIRKSQKASKNVSESTAPAVRKPLKRGK